VRPQLLERLLRHIQDPVRLQDVEIGGLHLQNEVLDRRRLVEAGDIRADAARLVVRQDRPPGKERLTRLDDPVVVSLSPPANSRGVDGIPGKFE
jgi:hypothetical protein